MKNRIVVALLIALALVAIGPPLVASPMPAAQAAPPPAQTIVSGDLSLSITGLEAYANEVRSALTAQRRLVRIVIVAEALLAGIVIYCSANLYDKLRLKDKGKSGTNKVQKRGGVASGKRRKASKIAAGAAPAPAGS